jgi:trehalose-6-phosphatase
VTGRSLGEVRDRCATLDLAGGVAEYGAVVLDHARNHVEQLVSTADLAVLDRLRAALRERPDVRVEEDHRHSVRVHGPGPGWDAPAVDVLEDALAGLGADRARVRVVPGRYQSDVVAAAVDKGAGLAALARLLGEPGAPAAVRLAVGDTAADLPMLVLAEHAFAPANATAEVRRAGVEVLRQPYAAGVAAAAARVLGHPPGGCPTCRPGPHPCDTRLLLTMLDAPRAGRAGLPAAAARLAAELAGLRQPSR